MILFFYYKRQKKRMTFEIYAFEHIMWTMQVK
jgi:hypothetical protein